MMSIGHSIDATLVFFAENQVDTILILAKLTRK